MINAKALKRHLKALGKELADNCYCTRPDCEEFHPFEGEDVGVPPYGMTLVTSEGNLDEANNKEYVGGWWGTDGHLDVVVDQIDILNDWAENLVIVEHATGNCWRGTEFPG